jgi:hypothetical protein
MVKTTFRPMSGIEAAISAQPLNRYFTTILDDMQGDGMRQNVLATD